MKWVLITGSSKGLGKELALVFAEKGYNIIIHGRDMEMLNKVRDNIFNKGVDCEVIVGDLNSDDCIEKLNFIAKEKDISVLINNAGLGLLKQFQEFEISEIEEILNTNLIAVIKLTKKIYELFFEKKFGIIININSMDGLRVTKGERTAYSSSKFGLKGFTDALRYESKNHNIQVAGVYLGAMRTSMCLDNSGNFEGLMDAREVAQTIFKSIVDKDSLAVDEIHINRKSY